MAAAAARSPGSVPPLSRQRPDERRKASSKGRGSAEEISSKSKVCSFILDVFFTLFEVCCLSYYDLFDLFWKNYNGVDHTNNNNSIPKMG